MSDSSATLLFLDPHTFHVHKRLTVLDADGEPVTWINELEYIAGGKLLANHFMSQELLVIDTNTGRIEAFVDLSNLNPARYAGCKCRCGPPTANGIGVSRRPPRARARRVLTARRRHRVRRRQRRALRQRQRVEVLSSHQNNVAQRHDDRRCVALFVFVAVRVFLSFALCLRA